MWAYGTFMVTDVPTGLVMTSAIPPGPALRTVTARGGELLNVAVPEPIFALAPTANVSMNILFGNVTVTVLGCFGIAPPVALALHRNVIAVA